jgi:hypothetical protein
VDRSNKVEKSESATKEGKPQEKVGQGKSEENTDSSESVEVGKPGE